MAEVEGPTSRRNRYVATACEACKSSKKKCDGNQPCQNCVDHNRHCVVDESRDRRRGRKRTWDDLQIKAGALDAILGSLRSSNDASVQSLLRLIRSEASVGDIVDHAKKILLSDDIRNRSQDRARQDVMRIATLTDDPPIRVPSKPWTNVTDDDHLISHLISVFFIWHWSAYPTVDQELFVTAMNSRNLSSRFCTPLLVNAMLAVACTYSDHPSVFADPDDQYTRGQHFLEEARQRWNEEEGKVSLTNLQTISLLIFSNIVSGKDQVSSSYLTQSVSLRTELERRYRIGLRQDAGENESIEYQRSLCLAVWGTFMCEVETAISLLKSVNLRMPRVARPFSGNELETMAYWRPYPGVGPEISFSSKGTLNERINLYQICCHVPPLLLTSAARRMSTPEISGSAISDNQTRLRSILNRLHEWYIDLPQYAGQDSDDPEPVAPPMVNTLLAYLTYQITVQEAIIHDEVAIEALDTDAGTGKLAQERPARKHAEDGIILASTKITNILRKYQHSIGMTDFPMYSFQASMKSVSVLLNMIQRPEVPDVFHSLILALSATSRRWILAQGALKVLWLTIKERKLDSFLQESTKEVLSESAVEHWPPHYHLIFERCSYPNYAASETGRRDVEDVGELLEKAARLNLDY